MRKYQNEEYLQRQIMESSRHLFMYGYESNYRSQFLHDLEEKYPIVFNSNKPIALYFDMLGLPKIEYDIKSKDDSLINRMSSEYLNFTIVSKILEETLKIDRTNRLSGLIQYMNTMRNKSHNEIKTSLDLIKQIEFSRDFYNEMYRNYIMGTIEETSLDNVAIPFCSVEAFISLYKEVMGIDSYFGIIFDKKASVSISSIKSINDLISSRINKDISIKIAVNPNAWDTYWGTGDWFVEKIHDYDTLELDNSAKEYMQRSKKKFFE